MHLLAVNLQRSSAINYAIYGNFSSPKSQEIVVVKGTNNLELLRPDKSSGKLISICSTPVFAVIRSILAFRLAGANKDYVVIGSDSGKISIVEFDASINDWKLIHCEPYGKTACRRIVPGQYLAADPKGRAIMIASIEKQRFVYVMNRDSANRLTISSPLEAHKSECILFSVCGVDVGFDNPVFAMIELDYTEVDQDSTGEALAESEKKLTYYELDLGLNHVVRKWSEPIARTANFLLTVPGGDDGPSGVLICCENWISYKHQGHVEVRSPIPRRIDYPAERGLLIVNGTLHRQKDFYFYMVQSEIGDLYKVTIVMGNADDNSHDMNENGSNSSSSSSSSSSSGKQVVVDVIITVFDSIQLANNLCITKTGLLFVASEFSNHSLYQFQGILEDESAVRSNKVEDEEIGDDALSASQVAPTFIPTSKLKNLLLIDDIPSLAPVTDLLIEDIGNEENVQILTACGRGHHSSLRILRPGVSVTEMAVSDLPGRAIAVWTVKKSQNDIHDRYIIVSLMNSTLVLSVGDTVEEITDSGFLSNTNTLQIVLLDDNALLQVYPFGIRHIRQDKRVSEWKTPNRRMIEKSAVNSRQVVISLTGGEIYYFELDAAGQLMEMGQLELGKEISALDLGVVPPGRMRSSFLAVACHDDTIQLLSLDPSDLLTQRSAMSLSARADSLCLILMTTAATTSATPSSGMSGSDTGVPTLYLNVGLSTGVLIRVVVDPLSGSLTDSRQKFLGPKAIKLFRISLSSRTSMMALSTRPWVAYTSHTGVGGASGRYFQSPVNYEAVDYVSSFSSDQCPEGIVAVRGSTLRIITIDNLGEQFNQTILPLRYTPRKIVRLGVTKQIVLIESDHNEYSETERKALTSAATLSVANATIDNGKALNGSNSSSSGGESGDVVVGVVSHENGETVNMEAASSSSSSSSTTMVTTDNEQQQPPQEGEEEEEDESECTILPLRGPMPPGEGKWASCIRVLEPNSGNTLDLIELTQNESAFSLCSCRFLQHSEEVFIIVGIVKGLIPTSKQFQSCCIRVHRVLEGRLQVLHSTEVEDIPQCMIEFQGKLLVGSGKCLRLYELGKRKLLKKCENKLFPTAISKLLCHGDRIYVGDACESIHFVKYRRLENTLSIFADDIFPRFITAMCILDYNTIAAADKFGNVFVLRLPADANDNVEVASGARQLWDLGVLSGAPIKLNCESHYYIGEIITSLIKCALVVGGQEVLVASTITGGLYVLVPFTSKDDVTFFQHLEMYMRQEYINLCQRDHLSYRSYFQPVKETIDGDLCGQYAVLNPTKQKEFAADVDRTVVEVLKKLEDARNII